MSVWSYAAPFRRLAEILDFCAVYFATLWGRCAVLSFPILGIALLLRKLVWKRGPFIKGAVWAVFVSAPFLGKLRVFYESRACLPLILWQSWCSGYWPVRYGYLLGIAVGVILSYRRRAKLRRILRGLPSEEIDGQRIFLCDAEVSPFATGLLFPKIVIPKIAWEHLNKSDLQTIVLHERTHIRLGHLWIFFLWDVLCSLLWVNPFLRFCAGKLREDMEHICDAVTIRQSGRDALSYGRALLESLTLFQEKTFSPAAFAGGTAFDETKERFRRVRDYRPYSRRNAAAICVCMIALSFAVLSAIQKLSLPRYTELSGFTVYQVSHDTEFVTVYQTDSDGGFPLIFDGNGAKIDVRAFRALLPDEAPKDGLYGILWGGFLKVPGIGGAMNAVYFDSPSDGAAVSVEFFDVNDLLYVQLIKLL
ncbi:MAG: M56 family metallopeptidase [Oscillibacter sp.]|nr:M56 family metallopeptidase [Oscillibacter sp.]